MNENTNYSEEAVQRKKHCKSKLLTATFILSIISLVLIIALVLSLLFGLFPTRVGRVLIVRVADSCGGNQAAEDTEDMLNETMDSVVVVLATTSSSVVSGTGVILTEDGYIVTNHHIIKDSFAIRVRLYNDEYDIKATVVATDEQSDLALLKIDVTGLSAATFANSDECRVGERVYAIGTPENAVFGWSVSEGIISGLNRKINIYRDGILSGSINAVQTDASLSQGNSGGPLLNSAGQVIGIVTAKLSGDDKPGFAITSNDTLAVINELLK